MVDVSLLHGIGNKPSTGGALYFTDMIRTKFPEKRHYIYLTTNLINGKQYIGSRSFPYHKNLEQDAYLGSGTYLQNAIRKYGITNFKKVILNIYKDRNSAFLAEKEMIEKYNTLSPNGYNLSPSGGVPGLAFHSDNSKQKIGIGSKNNWKKKEYREKQLQLLHKRYEDPIAREKISIRSKERYSDPKEREKQSIIMKKVRNTPEIKEFVRTTSNKYWSDPESRKKASEQSLGRKRTEEAKESISRKAKERWADPEYKAWVIKAMLAKGKRK